MAPRYDILALDIDGTLLRSDKALASRDAEAVRAAARAGVRIVLATARPPRSTRPILEALGLFDAALATGFRSTEDPAPVTINYNGALQWRHAMEGAGAAVEHLPLEATTAASVVRHARKLEARVSVWVEILDRWFTDRQGHEYEPHEAEGTILGTETSKTHGPDELADLEAILRIAPTKVMFLAPPTRLARVFEGVEAKFARKGALACKVSDAHLFSVCHADADKGLALRQLAHRWGVPRERVLAIGDAPNDAAMLRWAGRGLAVANAWDEAKVAADSVLDRTNDQFAVEDVIRSELGL